MSANKRVTVNAKLTIDESIKLNKIAENENISLNALIRLLINGVLSGDIEIEKGELVVPDDCSEIVREDFEENMRYKSLRMDKLVSAFERKGYPDAVIRQSVEQITSQVLDGSSFSSKRYREEC